MEKCNRYSPGLIISLTLILVCAQFIFLGIHFFVEGNSPLVFSYFYARWLSNPHVLSALLLLMFTQVLTYSLFVFLVWHATNVVGKLLTCNQSQRRVLAMCLWLSGVVFVICANFIYVTHSFFSTLMEEVIGREHITMWVIDGVFFLTAGIWVAALTAVILHNKLRSIIVLLVLIFLYFPFHFFKTTRMSVPKQPNIIIVGFDALRPDFLSYFNPQRAETPFFDEFLASSTVFSQAYTPLARTSPSLASVLTGRYPIHHRNRDNLTPIATMNLESLLPDTLRKAGYETVYASDENLFNNMNAPQLGFEHIIGSSGNAPDFIFSFLNDFPLSNLVMLSPLAKYIFPYNVGNHASTHTFDPEDSLSMLQQQLQQRSQKPLFLTVHFNITAWPFYWLGDQESPTLNTFDRYSLAVTKANDIFGKFLSMLHADGLLDHTIVVLISDHGIALGEHGDRVTAANLYVGDKRNMKKLTYYPYKEGVSDHGKFYGVDTADGYGTEVLSLTQHHHVFAMRFYDSKIHQPRVVKGIAPTIDIMPTVLDILHLHPSATMDGISLLPYLQNPSLHISKQRSLFFENAYSPDEINQSAINALNVLYESYRMISVDNETGKVRLTNEAINIFNANKQRAILKDNWLLAFYPTSKRNRLHLRKNQIPNYSLEVVTMPAYRVLVNLQTGKWTTEMNSEFARHSPMLQLMALWEKKPKYGRPRV